MLSITPDEFVETGPLPDDLLAPYEVAVRIATVANSMSLPHCTAVPDAALWVLAHHLQQLEIPGDVFGLLTSNAQELNSVRDRPVTYWNIANPNAHLVVYELWDRLLANAWITANSLDLVPGQCCADRFNFDIFHLSVLKDHGAAVRDGFAKWKLPSAEPLIAELALEVSKVARQRAATTAARQAPAAEDDSAFRPATELLVPDGFPKSYKELRQALSDNTWIRWDRPKSKQTGRPVGNRCRVHLGDWHKYLEQRRRATPNPLYMPAHIVDAAVQEVQARKDQVDRQRGAK
jgi:hypothetical protein